MATKDRTITPATWLRILMAVLGWLAALRALGFIVIACCGRVSLTTPIGRISTGKIDRAFWHALALLVLWILLDIRQRRKQGGVASSRPVHAPQVSGHEHWLFFGAVTLTGVLYWIHTLYLSYQKVLMRSIAEVRYPFWIIHLAFGSGILLALLLMLSLRKSHSPFTTIGGTILLVCAPCFTGITNLTACSFAATAVAMFLLWAIPKSGKSRVMANIAIASTLVAVLIISFVTFRMAGYTSTLEDAQSCLLPGFMNILAIIGILDLIVHRQPLQGILSPVLLAFPGIALMAGPPELAAIGRILVFPLAALLVATGIRRSTRFLSRSASPLGMNVFLLLLAGILLDTLITAFHRYPFTLH